MKQCDILGEGVKTYSDVTHLTYFHGVIDPSTPMIYAPDCSCTFAVICALSQSHLTV